LKHQVKKLIEKFFKYHNVEEGNGVAVRLAKRFALAYASGVLAAQYKILPFSEDDIMEGISRCYHDATIPKLDEEKNIFTAEFIEAIRSDNIPDLTKKCVDEAMIEELDVVITEVKSESVFAANRLFFEKNVIKNLSYTIDFLRKKKVLCDQKDKGRRISTRPLNYKSKHFSRRYCLRREALLKLIKK